MTSKSYRGIVIDATTRRVTVIEGDRGRPLDPRLDLRNHSPTGINWGYGGSGPAQLALALLCDAIGVEAALPIYQRFKFQRIAFLPFESGWLMTQQQIVDWAEEFLRTRS